MQGHVFHDPSGLRARRAAQAATLLLALITLIFAGFAATLVLSPRLPHLDLKDPHILRALHVETAHRLKGKPAWARVQRPRNAAPGGLGKPLTVGFYVNWDANSRASLAHNLNEVDVISPQWVALKGSGGDIEVTDDPQGAALIASAKKPLPILPLVHNSANEVFNAKAADDLLASPAARAKLIDNLVKLAKARGFAGYIFDLENFSDASTRAYPGFIAQARAALKPYGREVWVTAPFASDEWPLQALQKASDTLVLMAYDQHYGGGDPGPTAGQDWFVANLADRFRTLDPAKTVLALGAYGYDWTEKDKAGPGSARAVTFHEAMVVARDSQATVSFDPASLNPTFAYSDDQGRNHSVWFLDAVSAYDQVRAADGWRPRGYGLWRLGSEDPGVWSVLGKPYGKSDPAPLARVKSGPDVDFDGTGEVLSVEALPSDGVRTFTVDPDTGFISDEAYQRLPGGYVIQRYGAHPGLVAITFDDGPDARWTGKLLDILKAKHAPATFFVIGENMQKRPDLVEREVEEGHMVGNHSWTHPNIAELPKAGVMLELNSTQRLFETVTGKSMRLFRPPFFGDAEPSTPREVEPILAAQEEGYLTVGLRIDPDDWKKPDPQHIIDRTLERLSDTDPYSGGQIVLLHDSGGDRSRTVAALPGLIDALRAHGYRLVTVAQLAGMTPEEAMPPTARNSVDLMLDRLGFGFLRGVDDVLAVLFVGAIVLGLLRLMFMAVLAMVHMLRAPGRTPAEIDPEDGPLVTVLIPCFNEEKVIAASVTRVLASTWKRLEVIVLDDGSKDRTSEEVRRHFADEPRVRLMSFENGGKARALNRGLAVATGEIVVALDADTQFAPKTIALLARWFKDPAVGAVAGNAIVGNRSNIITRCQALEYVTAQNLERRALAALGAVTVVPGAVGAWRKAALEQQGGYPADTLAEDQDLTIAIQRAGWRVEFDPEARAYTEAPDTVKGLLKQRFRWSFGTLQCLWKHRSALFNRERPVLGFVALPQIWLFQIVLTTVAPLVDLAIVWSLASAAIDHAFHPVEWQPDNLIRSGLYWAIFILVDLSAAALGMALERQAPWADLPWIPAQRFGYRQIMYFVVLKAISAAVRGPSVGWGSLERRGTVSARA